MSRLRLIGSNVLTALATAAATSAFWLVAFNHGQIDRSRLFSLPPPDAVQQIPSKSRVFLGPTGIAIPVAGVKPGDLADTFTQARAGGARVHDAIDIMAPEGTAVVAAAPGRVEKLFYSDGGGGITAYVRSPDGHYNFYYAHLRNYAPGLREGQAIRQGDLIGNVGHTGNASAGGPHLHFAINRMGVGQKWYQGTPINPYPLLAGKHRS